MPSCAILSDPDLAMDGEFVSGPPELYTSQSDTSFSMKNLLSVSDVTANNFSSLDFQTPSLNYGMTYGYTSDTGSYVPPGVGYGSYGSAGLGSCGVAADSSPHYTPSPCQYGGSPGLPPPPPYTDLYTAAAAQQEKNKGLPAPYTPPPAPGSASSHTVPQALTPDSCEPVKLNPVSCKIEKGKITRHYLDYYTLSNVLVAKGSCIPLI